MDKNHGQECLCGSIHGFEDHKRFCAFPYFDWTGPRAEEWRSKGGKRKADFYKKQEIRSKKKHTGRLMRLR